MELNDTLFRAIQQELRAEYPVGHEFTWPGFCSTTVSAEVLGCQGYGFRWAYGFR